MHKLGGSSGDSQGIPYSVTPALYLVLPTNVLPATHGEERLFFAHQPRSRGSPPSGFLGRIARRVTLAQRRPPRLIDPPRDVPMGLYCAYYVVVLYVYYSGALVPFQSFIYTSSNNGTGKTSRTKSWPKKELSKTLWRRRLKKSVKREREARWIPAKAREILLSSGAAFASFVLAESNRVAFLRIATIDSLFDANVLLVSPEIPRSVSSVLLVHED